MYRTRYRSSGPKKLLALDGGGIRGLISLGVLARIETLLRESRGDSNLVLGDYFDYVGGTSTGAIIAAGLARGLSVGDLQDLYLEHGRDMFVRAAFYERLFHRYRRGALASMLQDVFGKTTIFGDEDLRCLLMVVLRNATTDSPWPLSNNPDAHYSSLDRADSNLALPLWQLVRASAAAPVYFAPERIQLGGHEMLFVDGGVTMYNNPAFKLFLMATLPSYHLEWSKGAEEMLVVSVGTGSTARANESLRAWQMNLIYNARSVPAALMYAAAVEQDALCRVFGRCLFGAPIDRELGALQETEYAGKVNDFTYLRYDADLSAAGLRARGLDDIEPAHVQKLDSVAHTAELQRVGDAVADDVNVSHFAGFLPEVASA